jgi:hypothetical protein
MTEIDPSVILKDGDCIYFRGVKYQKVEEPKPKTLLEIIREWNYDEDYLTDEELANRIERQWLGDVKIEKNTTLEFERGWNGCLEHLRYKIK